MTPSGSGPAVEAIGLVKEFEKGRRTLWRRHRCMRVRGTLGQH